MTIFDYVFSFSLFKKKLLLFISIILIGGSLHAQILYPSDDIIEYYRVLELKNDSIIKRINIYPSTIDQYMPDSLDWNPWGAQVQFIPKKNKYIKLLPVRAGVSYNSSYARGYNDGAAWQGKGMNSEITGGFLAKWGILRVTLAPVLYYAQNTAFDLASVSDAANPLNYQFAKGKIDFVQRYGEEALYAFDWGQSEVRAVFKSLTIGISKQNVTLGPAQYNPIAQGTNSAGIPHIDLGTDKPIKTIVGSFESKVYWGVLKESNYFDQNEENNNRYWSIWTLGFSPSFIKGLSLGVNRIFYKRGEEFVPKDLYIAFARYTNPNAGNPNAPIPNDEYDQMATLTMKWVYPEVGFEAYFEFGKNDFGGGFFGSEPEHARAYTLGFQKIIDISENSLIKLSYEHSTLDKAKSARYKPHNKWFTHSVVSQGYTYKGQVISAGVGPGAQADYFDIKYYYPKGLFGLNLQRIRFDDDYFTANFDEPKYHDFEWTGSFHYTRIVSSNRLRFELGLSNRISMYYIPDNNTKNLYMNISFTHNFH